MNIEIRALQVADRAAWEPLARGYKRFYETDTSDAEYAAAWQRLLHDPRFLALAAWRGDAMVGIVHALFHASTWADEVCYLQDLFVAEAARGSGAGAARRRRSRRRWCRFRRRVCSHAPAVPRPRGRPLAGP